MSALASRDLVFTELHRNVLKPFGFRKKGHWSILNEGAMFQTVYLRASRWSSTNEASFWIDLQVFNSDWYTLVFGPKSFPGPGEGTPSLVSEELNKMIFPAISTIKIDESTDVVALTDALSDGFTNHGWPLMQRCASLEGVLAHYQASNSNSEALSAAAICILLKRNEEARKFFEIAKKTAPHENYLRWVESRESAIWANDTKR